MGRLAECSDCGAVFARDGAVDAQEPVSRCKACAARAAGQPAPAAPPARPAVQIHQNFGAMNPIEIDRKLWRGAAASGWSAVHAAIEVEGEHRSVWRYISPDGLVYQSRLEASADATLGEAGNELRAQLHEFAQQEAEGARGEAEAEEGGGGAARKRGKEEGGSKEEGGGEEGEGPCTKAAFAPRWMRLRVALAAQKAVRAFAPSAPILFFHRLSFSSLHALLAAKASRIATTPSSPSSFSFRLSSVSVELTAQKAARAFVPSVPIM
eukprot:gene10142-4024_t